MKELIILYFSLANLFCHFTLSSAKTYMLSMWERLLYECQGEVQDKRGMSLPLGKAQETQRYTADAILFKIQQTQYFRMFL